MGVAAPPRRGKAAGAEEREEVNQSLVWVSGGSLSPASFQMELQGAKREKQSPGGRCGIWKEWRPVPRFLSQALEAVAFAVFPLPAWDAFSVSTPQGPETASWRFPRPPEQWEQPGFSMSLTKAMSVAQQQESYGTAGWSPAWINTDSRTGTQRKIPEQVPAGTRKTVKTSCLNKTEIQQLILPMESRMKKVNFQFREKNGRLFCPLFPMRFVSPQIKTP
nr:uncharacterized protein LOC105707398 [Aotus nancymaae]